jgi:hypothetical protein
MLASALLVNRSRFLPKMKEDTDHLRSGIERDSRSVAGTQLTDLNVWYAWS